MNKDVIYVRIDKDIKEKLDMYALEDQRSLNNLITVILTKWVEAKEKEKKEAK